MTRPPIERRAFTLTELLVVVSIIVLLLAIAVPAFSSIAYQTERTTGQNSIRTALSAARDAAVQSPGGADAAAVFSYTPQGRLQVVTCIAAGVLDDLSPSGTLVSREVFVPAAGFEPIQIPSGWSVSGYAPPNSIDNAGAGFAITGWYDSGNYPAARGNWVLPESDFYFNSPSLGSSTQQAADGAKRQTFMVRFEGRTGLVDSADIDPVLVLSPSPLATFRGTFPHRVHRADQASRGDRFVQRVLSDASLTAAQRRQLLGDESSDTMLARPVPQVALYSLRRLAAGIGARGLNRTTGTIYTATGEPDFDAALFGAGFSADAVSQSMNDWIEGERPSSDAVVYGFDRYSGSPVELPRLEGGGP